MCFTFCFVTKNHIQIGYSHAKQYIFYDIHLSLNLRYKNKLKGVWLDHIYSITVDMIYNNPN